MHEKSGAKSQTGLLQTNTVLFQTVAAATQSLEKYRPGSSLTDLSTDNTQVVCGSKPVPAIS